eukprot:scaffold63920_cov51-Phaeocystis_antarctica.AAC.1
MDGRVKSIQQQKLQGTPQVYKRGLPSAHGRKGEIDSTTNASGHPAGVQAKGAKRAWTEGSESILQQQPQGTLEVFKREDPRAHGRKGANQFTTKATGHPSSVQARGVQRTWTEGQESIQQQKPQGTPQ